MSPIPRLTGIKHKTRLCLETLEKVILFSCNLTLQGTKDLQGWLPGCFHWLTKTGLKPQKCCAKPPKLKKVQSWSTEIHTKTLKNTNWLIFLIVLWQKKTKCQLFINTIGRSSPSNKTKTFPTVFSRWRGRDTLNFPKRSTVDGPDTVPTPPRSSLHCWGS